MNPFRNIALGSLRGWLLFSAVIAAIFTFHAHVQRQRDHSLVRISAINSLKSAAFALTEFDLAYGRYPDASTAAAVKEATGTPLTLGSATSNQLFRQLLATGSLESHLWAKTTVSPQRPDDIFTTDATALQAGECGFAYIAGLDSKSPPGTPLLMAPFLPGTRLFDPKPFQGKALILFLGGSNPRLSDIGTDGRVILNNLDLFDPRQPFWHGKAPDVKWPE
ncbi:hypothetical protein [Luteolibacter sp. Populi]|uniref:hypothetical protein n=1 Tax=Luteolibacter sp. Populi TaxID=3230487 RepID=UPI00346798CA